MRRVVVTGLGLVTPLGGDVETSWANILAGMSGAGPITKFDPSDHKCRIACEVIDFNRFGNVQLNVRPADLAASGLDAAEALRVEAVSGAVEAKRGSTYADFAAGEYGVLFDPRGWLTIVRGNPASALDGLGLSLSAPVWLSGPDGSG